MIFQAAGQTGLGVIDEVVASDRLAIGTDSNQNFLAPGNMLTSMIKRVDLVTYDALTDGYNGVFTGGAISVGIEDGGVDWALDRFNAALITPKIMNTVTMAKRDILLSKLEVHDYLSDGSCPY